MIAMSRVGKNPVIVPPGVEVTLEPDRVTAKGKNGQLAMRLVPFVSVTREGDTITVQPSSDDRRARAMWGTTRACLANLIEGVHTGFTKILNITGVGYRAAVQGSVLRLQLGYSHDVEFAIPSTIRIECPEPTQIVLRGADLREVGELAAKIRSRRPPEPYKGKGIRYSGEKVRSKEGKKK